MNLESDWGIKIVVAVLAGCVLLGTVLSRERVKAQVWVRTLRKEEAGRPVKYAWLVVRGGEDNPEYLVYERDGMAWTHDVGHGLRLSRKIDAEDVWLQVTKYFAGPDIRVEQHGFGKLYD
jgi:hypothetical protein